MTGTIQLPDGTAVNGTLEFALSQRAQTTTPPILYVPEKTTCAISNGAIAVGCGVQGNDTLNPAGTFYRVRILDVNNRQLGPSVNYTISGVSVDLGSLPVTATDTLVPPDGSVVGNLSVTGNLIVGGSADTSHLRLLGLTADPVTVIDGSLFHRSDLNRVRLHVQGLQLFDGTQYVDINSTTPNTIDIGGDLKVFGGTNLGQFGDLKCSSAPNPPDANLTRLYCLNSDSKLYFKDSGGTESGPLAALNSPQSWTGAQTFDTVKVGSWNNVFIVDGVKYTTIQAAMAAAEAAGGGTVFVPRGNYTLSVDPFAGLTNPITLLLGEASISTSVSITPTAGSKIIGTGYQSLITMTANPPLRTIDILTADVEVAGIRIKSTDTDGDLTSGGFGGIHFRSAGAARGWAHHNILDNVATVGITVSDGATQIDVHDNIIINSREHGIYASNSDKNNIHDNIILDAGQNSVHPAVMGIKCAACTTVNIHHNYVENPQWHGISLEESSPATDISDTVVQGNTVISPGATGIRIAPTITGKAVIRENNVVVTNLLAENAGIFVQNNPGGHMVMGNRVVTSNTATNGAGIRTTSTGASYITGNAVIADAAGVPWGISADVGSGHIVTNNWVLNGAGNFSTGIRSAGSTSAFVGWNTVQATTRYLLASDAVIASHQETTKLTAGVNLAGPLTIGSGIAADGAGYKHQRVSTGSVAAGQAATVSVPWPTPFADTNYTVVGCAVQDSTPSTLALRLHHIESKTAAGLAVRLVNDDGAAAHSGTLHCTAVHD